jgi:hypothetical protein
MVTALQQSLADLEKAIESFDELVKRVGKKPFLINQEFFRGEIREALGCILRPIQDQEAVGRLYWVYNKNITLDYPGSDYKSSWSVDDARGYLQDLKDKEEKQNIIGEN